MVQLQAFVDDSASDVGDRRLFLACYINSAERWRRFSRDWGRELRRHPQISYFKMSEAQNLSGQFRRISASQRDDKIKKLASLIAKYDPWFVYFSVSRTEYAEILAPNAPYNLKNPYFTCFWGIIETTAAYHLDLARDLKNTAIPPVDFIFDTQEGLGDDAALWYDWLKADQRPEIRDLIGGRPVFHDDKDTPPLQASDMLAWHVRRKHERGSDHDEEIMDLLTGNGAARHMDAAALRTLAESMSKVPGVWRVQTKKSWKATREVTRDAVNAGRPAPSTNLWWMRYLGVRAWAEDIKKTFRRWWSR